MAEKQPRAYVICRYSVTINSEGWREFGDNIPVKVFDTRREARAYTDRMNRRTKKFGYLVYSVKQG